MQSDVAISLPCRVASSTMFPQSRNVKELALSQWLKKSCNVVLQNQYMNTLVKKYHSIDSLYLQNGFEMSKNSKRSCKKYI